MTQVPGRLGIVGVRCSTADAKLAIDLTADTDLGPAARSDAMADAVDIAEMVATVRHIVDGSTANLLESLVVRCAQALLDRFPAIERIEVRITKSEPPGLDAAAEVVELTLSR